MDVIFCNICHRVKVIEDSVTVDFVSFAAVPKFAPEANLPPTPDNVSWRRVTQPALICADCAPVEA